MAKLSVQIVGSDQLSPALDKAAASAEGFGSRVESVGKSVTAVGAKMALFGGAVTAVAGEAIKSLVESAVGMQEQMDKLGVSMGNQGESLAKLTPQIDALEASNRKLGFTNSDTIQSLTEFTQAGEKVGQATSDMGLAEDLARSKGESLAAASEELVKVHQGLLRPLKELGITLPAITTNMDALKAAHKATGDAITQTEKNLATEQDKMATGSEAIDLMKGKLDGLSASFANTAQGKMAEFDAQTQNIKQSLGDLLLPIVTKVADGLDRLATSFDGLSPETQKMIAFGIAGAAAFGAAVTVIGTVVGVIGSLITAVGFLAANPLVLLVAGVALLAGAMAAAVLAPKQLEDALEKLGLSASTSKEIVSDLQAGFEYLKQAGDDLANMVRDNWSTIQSVIQGTEQIVMGVVHELESLWSEFGSNITSAAQTAWTLIQATIRNALTVIEGVIDVFSGLIHGNWSEVWQGIKDIVSGTWSQIEAEFSAATALLGDAASVLGKVIESAILKPLEKLGNDFLKEFDKLKSTVETAADDAYNWAISIGEKIVSGTLDGLVNLGSAIKDKVESGIKGALSNLNPFSPVEHGGEVYIGNAIVSGALAGLEGLKTGVNSKVSTATRDALTDATPLIQQAGQLLGQQQAQSIVDGVVGVQQTMGQQLQAALEAAMAPALAKEATAGAIQTAATHIGEATADAVVAGIVGKQPTMVEQIKTALSSAVQQAAQAATAAVSSFQSTFGSLANSVLSAFSTQTSGYVAPAQKLLDKEQLQDQVNQYADAVTSAAATLTTDQQALSQALAGGDPATIQAAQAQVLTDQVAYNASVRAQQEFQLSQTAIAQTAAYDKARTEQEDALATRLKNLETELSKEPDKWATAGASIVSILKQYDVPMYTAGQKIVDQFAGGIQDELPQLEAAAKAMAAAVAKYIPHSPAETGPLSTFSADEVGMKFGSDFAMGITAGVYSGAGMASFALDQVTSTPTPVGGGGGGSTTIQLTVQGFVGNEAQLVDQLSQAFYKAGRSGHAVWRGITPAAGGGFAS